MRFLVPMLTGIGIALLAFILGCVYFGLVASRGLNCTRDQAWIAFAQISVPFVVPAIAAILWRLIRRTWSATLILLGLLSGLVITLSYPVAFGAVDRGKQKRTMADLRMIGRSLEDISRREGSLPVLESVGALNERYRVDLPTIDAWRGQVDLRSGPNGYTVASYGSCGELDPHPWPGGATSAFEADIVLQDGQFFQWPEGQQR